MPVCTRCHKDWPEQYWVCPEDGTVLVAARAVGDGMRAAPVGIPREEDLAPGTMIGEYRVEGKLGEGGSATVFSATQPLIGKKVAIKIISRRLCADLHAVERFIGEARTVNQIQHPNLVDIFAFGVLPDGRAYLVMEWLQGETLQASMTRSRLASPRALDILLQIVDALEAAHEKGVVHRDLKPANVFLVERRGGEPMVKLLDFGIAKLADSDASVPKTRSGVAMGTAGYMSPEQARGKNVDHRTDIYALGCVAYEALLGQVPFVADTAIDILAMHLASSPPPPRVSWPDIPARLGEVLVAMLAKAPDERPSLAEVRATLLAAQRTVTPTMGIPVPGGLSRRARRRRWQTAAIAGGAVAAAIGAAWLFGMRAPRVVELPAIERESPQPNIAPLPAPSVAPKAKLPTTGILVVHAAAGAKVKIDGRVYPVVAGEVRVEVASSVEHAVDVAAPHRPPMNERVRVAPGATAEVSAAAGHAHDAAQKAHEKSMAAPQAEKPVAPAQKSPGGDYTLDPF